MRRRSGTCDRAVAVTLAAMMPLASLSGCSLMFVDGPPPDGVGSRRSVKEPIPCTMSYAWPSVDLLWTGLQLTGLVLGAAAAGNSSRMAADQGRISLQIVGTLVLGSLFATSTAVGFSRVSACNEVNRDYVPSPYELRHVPPSQPSPYGLRPVPPSPPRRRGLPPREIPSTGGPGVGPAGPIAQPGSAARRIAAPPTGNPGTGGADARGAPPTIDAEDPDE